MSTTLQRHQEKQRSVEHEVLGTSLGMVIVLGMIGIFVYLGVAGRTGRWPEAQECTVIGSRVVRDVIDGRRPLILWHGEYRVQYEVNGKRYSTWANAGWTDADRSFVQNKVDDLKIDCPVRVQYNPKNPAESVTHPMRR